LKISDPQQSKDETESQRNAEPIPSGFQESAAFGVRNEGKKKMIRIFNHYLHRRTLMQILFDFGLIIATVLGAVLSQVHLSNAVPNVVTYGIMLALSMFVINTATGFYERTPNRSLNQSCARAVLALLLVLPLEYVFNGLLPEAMPNRDQVGGTVGCCSGHRTPRLRHPFRQPDALAHPHHGVWIRHSGGVSGTNAQGQ
jgi:hypothetical protein